MTRSSPEELRRIEEDLRARLEAMEIKENQTQRDPWWMWLAFAATLICFAVVSYIYFGASA